jgi:hypothetical protein
LELIFPFAKIIIRGLLDFKFFGYLLGVNVIARQTKLNFGFKAYGMNSLVIWGSMNVITVVTRARKAGKITARGVSTNPPFQKSTKIEVNM